MIGAASPFPTFLSSFDRILAIGGISPSSAAGIKWENAASRSLLDMCAPPAAEHADPDRDEPRVAPTTAALEAEYQRKVAAGWLYLADITADETLRASYARIARHHTQLADAKEADVGS
jgi:hypothetical protein